MLGPALRQLFLDLGQVPEGERSEYQKELYRELKPLAEIRDTWAENLKIGSHWPLETTQNYDVWFEATPGEGWSSRSPDVVRTERFHFSIDPQNWFGATSGEALSRGRLDVLLTEGFRFSPDAQGISGTGSPAYPVRNTRLYCTKEDCPNKRD